MRRPSGDRHSRSVTNAISRPFHANSHGHEPLRRWFALIVWSAGVSNSAWRTPLGQVMRATSARAASPSPKCTIGDVMTCFCTWRPDRSSISPPIAERIDPLIAGRRGGTRPKCLPSIRFRSRGRSREPHVRPDRGPTGRAVRRRPGRPPPERRTAGRPAAPDTSRPPSRAARGSRSEPSPAGRSRRCCRGPRSAAARRLAGARPADRRATPASRATCHPGCCATRE